MSALAPFGRRLAALAVDWGLCLLIAHGLLGRLHWGSLTPLAVLLVENWLLLATASATVGHRLLGLQLRRLDGGPVGPLRAAVRAVLLCLALPPLLWDADHRGLHDRLAGTVLVRR